MLPAQLIENSLVLLKIGKAQPKVTWKCYYINVNYLSFKNFIVIESIGEFVVNKAHWSFLGFFHKQTWVIHLILII